MWALMIRSRRIGMEHQYHRSTKSCGIVPLYGHDTDAPIYICVDTSHVLAKLAGLGDRESSCSRIRDFRQRQICFGDS